MLIIFSDDGSNDFTNILSGISTFSIKVTTSYH